MADGIWNELGAAMGIKSIGVQAVRDAVNNAVAAASGYKAPVTDQLDKLSQPQGATLESSVEAMDAPAAYRREAERTGDYSAPSMDMQAERGRGLEAENDIGPDV